MFLICPVPIKTQADNIQPNTSIEQSPQTLSFSDSRVLAISSFLDEHRCSDKITDYNTAQTFVNLADKYSVDWRYEVIFYLKESTCSKHMPYQSNNPFGFMNKGGEAAGVRHFSSLAEAFEAEARYLATPLYAGKTISQITHIYCPPRAGEVYTYTADFTTYYNKITDDQYFYQVIAPQIQQGQLNSQ